MTLEIMTEGTKPTLIRTFETGATRDSDDGKFDYEGFFSPIVLEEFAEYMHKHRLQNDGSLRASDNWQKGIPKVQYAKSLVRHVIDVWKLHRGYKVFDRKTKEPVSIKEALCGVLFNAMGYLFEDSKELT